MNKRNTYYFIKNIIYWKYTITTCTCMKFMLSCAINKIKYKYSNNKIKKWVKKIKKFLISCNRSKSDHKCLLILSGIYNDPLNIISLLIF